MSGGRVEGWEQFNLAVSALAVLAAPSTVPVLYATSLVKRWRTAVAVLVVGVVGLVAHVTVLGTETLVERVFAWQVGFVDVLVSTRGDGAALGGYLTDLDRWRDALAGQWPVGVTLAGILAAAQALRAPAVELDDAPSSSWRIPSLRSLLPRERRPQVGVVLEPGGTDWEDGRRAVLPADAPDKSVVTIGATGSGKTTSMLTVVECAVEEGRKVVWLDMSGDPKLPGWFTAIMLDAGIPPEQIRLWPQEPYDAWRATNTADLAGRLMGLLKHDGLSYFQDLARGVTFAAVDHPNGPPRSAAEFVARLDYGALTETPRGRQLKKLRSDQVQSVAAQYRSFFDSIAGGAEAPLVDVGGRQHQQVYVPGVAAGGLDGDWAFGDTQAAFLGVNALGNQDAAAAAGRLFLREYAWHVTTTKPEAERWLLVVDEFSALHDPMAIDLVERVRKFGAGVVLGTQSVVDRKFDWDRVLATCGTAIVHRTAQPERPISLAGTQRTERRSWNFRDDDLTGSGSTSVGHEFLVDPQTVRRLPDGQAYVITGGRATRVQFHNARPESYRFAEAQRVIANKLSPSSPSSVEVVDVQPNRKATA